MDPTNFNARVQLGRVYFLMEEFFKAEQQFLKAQEIDPKRFHRNQLPEDYTCWGDVEPQVELDDVMFGDYEAEGSLYSFEETAYAAEDTDNQDSFRHGDFSSYQEWKRFQTLPPISQTEIHNIDWDQIFSDPLQ